MHCHEMAEFWHITKYFSRIPVKVYRRREKNRSRIGDISKDIRVTVEVTFLGVLDDQNTLVLGIFRELRTLLLPRRDHFALQYK